MGGAEIWLHLFLNTEIDKGELPFSSPDRFIHRKYPGIIGQKTA